MQALVNAFLQLVGFHPCAPGKGSFLIVPDDANDLSQLARSLYVDAGGAVKFTAADGSVDTWVAQAGGSLPIAARRVWQNGTTATGIHAIL